MNRLVRRLAEVLRTSTIAALVAFALPLAAWAAMMPLYSVPDELSHVHRAAGFGHGRSLEPVPERTRSWGQVVLPAFYGEGSPICYLHDPTLPSECQLFLDAEGEELFETAVRTYPPGFYLALAPPAAFVDSRTTVYLMRAIAVVIAAVLLTAGWVAATRRSGIDRRLAAGAFLLGSVPMVWSLAASVNPNGLEIVAGLATWATGLALVLGRPTRGAALAFAACSVVLVAMRPLSWLWWFAIAATVVVTHRRHTFEALRASAAARRAVLVSAGFAVAHLVFSVVTSDGAQEDRFEFPKDQSFARRFDIALDRQPTLLENLFSVTAPVGAAVPTPVWIGWAAAVVLLIVTAVATAERHWARVGLLAAAAACFAVPLLIEAAQMNRTWIFWQARYTLPFAAGVPLLAASIIGPRAITRMGVGATRAIVALVWLLATGAFAAFVAAHRRLLVGIEGDYLGALTDAFHGRALAVLVFGAVAHVALAVFATATVTGPRTPTAVPPTGEQDRPHDHAGTATNAD